MKLLIFTNIFVEHCQENEQREKSNSKESKRASYNKLWDCKGQNHGNAKVTSEFLQKYKEPAVENLFRRQPVHYHAAHPY